MAKVRGGNTGFAVALVVFGCGFVISLLVAIIFYTKIAEHELAEKTAKDALAVYISSEETTQANDYKSSGGTVFGATLDEIRGLEGKLREAEKSKTDFQGQIRKKDTQFVTLSTEKQALEQQLFEVRKSSAETMQTLQVSLNKALNENAALQSRLSDLQARLNQSLKDADAAAQERITDLTNQVKTFEGNVFAVSRERDNWKRKYRLAVEGRPKPLPIGTTSADGQVASVFGQGNDLFITVGRRKGLVIGMTFEVYDPQPVIRLSDDDEARGKATIEVYGLEDDSATCRVVRRDRGASIKAGDPVVNLAYDPNMTIYMYAFGDFDIEGDGGANDIGRIEALIQESAAELVKVSKTDAGIPILTPDINYVIIGKKPELPEKPDPDDFDSVKIAEYQAKLAAYEAYFSILDEAKSLRIPVLSQGRFLELIGYYVR